MALFRFGTRLHEFPAKACIMEGLGVFGGPASLLQMQPPCFPTLGPEPANQLQGLVDPAAAGDRGSCVCRPHLTRR